MHHLTLGIIMSSSKLKLTSSQIVAQYKCVKCKHEYSSRPGPTSCHNCGHNYVTWTNYTYLRDQRLFKRRNDE